MKILGIETSCDETACSIVEDGRKVLSNVIASQINLHAKTGGVVPEIAAREHILKMISVLDEALSVAKMTFDDVDAIAITKGPGLISSLIVGTETASVISYVKNKPLIPVQHIVGHIYANWLVSDMEPLKNASCRVNFVASSSPYKLLICKLASSHNWQSQIVLLAARLVRKLLVSLQSIVFQRFHSFSFFSNIKFPILVLTISGGHNELILMCGHNRFEVLGETIDDAAGEAFDKVARLLDLGYPGGPIISKIAKNGDPCRFKFPRAYLGKESFNFSFSGLKTAVLNEVKNYVKHEPSGLNAKLKADLAASFQEAVVDVLVRKIKMALEKYPEVKEVHLAGGVSANLRLREAVGCMLESYDRKLIFRYPKSIKYCTDNAAMIAGAAFYLYKLAPKKFKSRTNLTPTLSFEVF
ncbi:tRNA (adenosine(37)-N6)-threonylcarbamoyltransferase complex transferase subunit TsaD [Candidatus Peregrinibacteria bacterium]|nr:tRNA (adenosine(37)-N6)-threonylcarbamoyltransferase complex transferase subunit TsaD [Candidatus Peregrinibacteria bacterium]